MGIVKEVVEYGDARGLKAFSINLATQARQIETVVEDFIDVIVQIQGLDFEPPRKYQPKDFAEIYTEANKELSMYNRYQPEIFFIKE